MSILTQVFLNNLLLHITDVHAMTIKIDCIQQRQNRKVQHKT